MECVDAGAFLCTSAISFCLSPLFFLSLALSQRSVFVCISVNYTLRLQGQETSGISALLLGTPKVIKLTYLSIDDQLAPT